MGKRIITQRRGRGTMTYRASSHNFKGKINYIENKERTKLIKGKIIDLIHCPGHTAPLAKIDYENKEKALIPAPNNVKVGDEVFFGEDSPIKIGSILPLKKIPEGTIIYNIESKPGKPSYCRTSGSFARLLSKLNNGVVVKFHSKKEKRLNPECKATIGVVAGSGRVDKPFLKAGKKHHAMRARGRLYPRTSGVAMNAVDHPFGSGRGRHVGKNKIPPRNAPPGRNVGLIRARKTGRGGKKK
jgi:large subunit ribosomal protein L2